MVKFVAKAIEGAFLDGDPIYKIYMEDSSITYVLLGASYPNGDNWDDLRLLEAPSRALEHLLNYSIEGDSTPSWLTKSDELVEGRHVFMITGRGDISDLEDMGIVEGKLPYACWQNQPNTEFAAIFYVDTEAAPPFFMGMDGIFHRLDKGTFTHNPLLIHYGTAGMFCYILNKYLCALGTIPEWMILMD